MKLTRRAATLAGRARDGVAGNLPSKRGSGIGHVSPSEKSASIWHTCASNEEAFPLGFQAKVKKSQDPCEGVRARILVDAVVGDLSRGRGNGVRLIARPVEVVNRSFIDFHLHWRASRQCLLNSLDARRGLDRIILCADFQQKRDAGSPIRRKARIPRRVKRDGGAKITLWQIGRASAAIRRDGENHSSATVRPSITPIRSPMTKD